MKEVFSQELVRINRQSSKGNMNIYLNEEYQKEAATKCTYQPLFI